MIHSRRSTRVILSLLSLLVVIGAVVFSVSWQQQVSQAFGATGHSQLKLTSQPSNGAQTPVSVYIGSFDSFVYTLKASTGAKRWGRQTGLFVESSPEVVNGTVYIGSDDHHVYALNGSTCKLRWRFKTGSSVESSPEVA